MQRQTDQQDIPSSHTHHILQSSMTLNRRYVRRPSGVIQNAGNSTSTKPNSVIIQKKQPASRAPIQSQIKTRTPRIRQNPSPVPTHPTIKRFPQDFSRPSSYSPTLDSIRKTTLPQKVVNPYVSSANFRKASEKAQQASSTTPIFDQRTKMDQAFSLVSEQEEKLLTGTPRPTPIFTKMKKTKPRASSLKIPASNMTPSSVSLAFNDQTAEQKTAQLESKKNSLIKNTNKKLSLKSSTQPQPVSGAKLPTKKIHKNGKRIFFAFSCATAVVVSLFFIIQSNMPDLSVRVAAMQTGIQATYPNYIPRDYRLSGVYTAQDNSIAMNFVGPDNAKFTLSEEKLPWDSTTLLNRFVKNKWGESYDSVREQGITIYISGSNAAWVNAGIVYKITVFSGNLTKKQIKNIVTSL